MSTNNSLQSIMAYIIASHSYDRMQARDCVGVDDSFTYAAFLEWNRRCIRELPEDEVTWLMGLCSHISNNKISIMGLESCTVYEACAIYFDQNKRLCIVNTR